MPATRQVDEFESAIRAVCEPIFDKPLKDISSAKPAAPVPDRAPLRMEVQPQLVLLQKPCSILKVSAGSSTRNWTCGPRPSPSFLNAGWASRSALRTARHIKEEAPFWATALPQLPRLIHHALSRPDRIEAARRDMASTGEPPNVAEFALIIGAVAIGLLALELWRLAGS